MNRKKHVQILNSKIVTCPHCKQTGQYVNMKRWHFDQCKTVGERASRVIELHNEGLWSHAIARKLGMSYGTVQYILSRLQIEPNYKIYRAKYVGNKIVCGTCHTPKTKREFYAKSGYKRCRECLKQNHIYRLNSDIVWFFRERCTLLRKRAKVEITPEFLVELFTKQEGKCFYTDAEMVCVAGKGKSMLAVSVDQIVPDKGYTEGNVVLCTLRANMVKQDLTLDELKAWLPGWHQRLVDSGLINP